MHLRESCESEKIAKKLRAISTLKFLIVQAWEGSMSDFYQLLAHHFPFDWKIREGGAKNRYSI